MILTSKIQWKISLKTLETPKMQVILHFKVEIAGFRIVNQQRKFRILVSTSKKS